LALLLAGHPIGLAVGEKHCLPESVEDRKAGKQCRNPADINLVPGKQCHTQPHPLPNPGTRRAERITQALADNQPFNHTWNPPGPWKP